jgi:phage terminase large subunit-like protein
VKWDAETMDFIIRLGREVDTLKRDNAALKALTVDLASALEQHARTDCAPDEALPFMRTLRRRAKKLAGA